MNHRSAFLFPAALGFSAVAHMLLLFLWPYAPARPVPQPPQPIPVRLLEAPRPKPQLASSPPVPARRVVRPVPEPAPVAVEQSPQPIPQHAQESQEQAAESPLELAPPEAASSLAPQEAAGAEPATVAPPAGSGSDASAAANLAAEVSATQAVLSSLRARIVEKIRYPSLARANGWKGTVLLELLLDERGALEALAVRRSSGYAVLDKAAASLVRAVTPVDNPLGLPLRIEVPIAYELKD
jgi:protein TonB